MPVSLILPGIFPQFALLFGYGRSEDFDALNDRTSLPRKFFNGGCVVGRAEQLRDMYKYARDRYEDNLFSLFLAMLAYWIN